MNINKLISKSFIVFLLLAFHLTLQGAGISPIKPSKGKGTIKAPYQVSTPEHLLWMSDMVNNGNRLNNIYFVQVEDIDLSLSKDLNEKKGWTPIGGYFMIKGVRTKTGFEGHYDGQGHSISNLYINRPEEEYQALFGYVSTGSVRNLTLVDAYVSGLENVAVAFAYTFEANIENCHIKNSEIDCRAFYAGGLIGFQAWGSTKNSSADIKIYGRDYIGGLVGWCEEGFVRNCHTKGQLLGSVYNGVQPRQCGGIIGFCNKSKVKRVACSMSLIEGGDWTGGLFGSLEHSTISEAFSRLGKVVGRSYVGGIAGRTNESSIRNSYTSMEVQGLQNVGGVTGFFTYSSSLLDCVYSISRVSGSSPESYFIGAVLGGYGTGIIKNVIYDKSVNPSIPGIDGPNTEKCDVSSLSSQEMKQKASYPNWDFNNVWHLSSEHNGGLPILKWEIDPNWTSLSPNLYEDKGSVQVSRNGNSIHFKTNRNVELIYVFGIDGVALPFVRLGEGSYKLSLNTTIPTTFILVYKCQGIIHTVKKIVL